MAEIASGIGLPLRDGVLAMYAGLPVAIEWAAVNAPSCGAASPGQQCEPVKAQSMIASAPAIGSKPPGPVSIGSSDDGR